MLVTSALELVGNTPLVRLAGLEAAVDVRARLYAKLEYLNPAGSVKDRAALCMIERAEREGRLVEGGTVIEATSGNTGIGLAFVCAVKGYRLIVVMPDTMSVERRKLIAAYGAEIVLTDGALGMRGAVEEAKRLQTQLEGSFLANQFENPDNALAHYLTTGAEIAEDLQGQVDVFVSAVGSGGTLTGAGKYLKERLGAVRVVAVEPNGSPVLSGGEKGAHAIQGIGAGFVPTILDRSLIDEVMCVTDDEAFTYARGVAQTDGLFVGISSGAALSAAVRLAKKAAYTNQNIVVIFPDGGGRYLSTPLIEEK